MTFINSVYRFIGILFSTNDVSCNSDLEPGIQIRGFVSVRIDLPWIRSTNFRNTIPGTLTCKWAEAVWLVDVPKLELRVGGGGHQVTAVQELDVAHSLPVSLEHVQSLLRRPKKIILQSITDRRTLINHKFCKVFHETASKQRFPYQCHCHKLYSLSKHLLPISSLSTSSSLSPYLQYSKSRSGCFGPPGSASGSVSHKDGSGSGSFPFLIKVLSGLK